jgi:hypothetical protein
MMNAHLDRFAAAVAAGVPPAKATVVAQLSLREDPPPGEGAEVKVFSAFEDGDFTFTRECTEDGCEGGVLERICGRCGGTGDPFHPWGRTNCQSCGGGGILMQVCEDCDEGRQQCNSDGSDI